MFNWPVVTTGQFGVVEIFDEADTVVMSKCKRICWTGHAGNNTSADDLRDNDTDPNGKKSHLWNDQDKGGWTQLRVTCKCQE